MQPSHYQDTGTISLSILGATSRQHTKLNLPTGITSLTPAPLIFRKHNRIPRATHQRHVQRCVRGRIVTARRYERHDMLNAIHSYSRVPLRRIRIRIDDANGCRRGDGG